MKLNIDPIGRDIDGSIIDILRESNVTYITNYPGRLQYTSIEEGEGVRWANGNINDCGPMLTYLLTRAAHREVLPTANNIEESQNIGFGLRRLFLNNDASGQVDNLHKIHITEIVQGESSSKIGTLTAYKTDSQNSREEYTRKFIDVPQGCYAIITPKADENIIGMVTCGMDPCSHVIILNKSSKAMVLCHADHLTDLENQDHGVPTWIARVCPDRDYQNLIIDIGERANSPRFRIYDGLNRYDDTQTKKKEHPSKSSK
jgi:hypothetical protein